jgi:glycosyltransferase involved in cell wall biosynthesis
MVFYHPVPLNKNPTSGSQVRPVRMLGAFRGLGFQVDMVVGTSRQRRAQMKKIQDRIQAGVEYAFMYAESATVPIPLADPHHLPVRPFQDVLFFASLQRSQIPIGLFYRDIYWQVDDLKYEGPWWKRLPKRAFLWLEWGAFRRYVDRLFLPTERIRSLLPTEWPEDEVSALPPGCEPLNPEGEEVENARSRAEGEKLRLFYVGGITPPYYDLRPLFDVVGRVEDVCVTLCCREEEWEEQREMYGVDDRQDVSVVHANSNEIGRYYRAADLAADLRRPEGYLRTALPVKLIEAVGYGIPTVLLQKTAAAEFVEEEEVGWTFSSIDEAEAGMRHLRDHRGEIREKSQDVEAVRSRHTWQARARRAASLLAGSAAEKERALDGVEDQP